MGLLIFTHAQITPEKVSRSNGSGGFEMVINPQRPEFPPNNGIAYQPAHYNRFSANAADRVILLDSDTGTATLAEIKTAIPSFIESRLKLVRDEAQRVIVSKWPLWVQLNCANGLYGSAVAALCVAEIASVINASNTAEDAISNATTMEQLLAVSPAWPVL